MYSYAVEGNRGDPLTLKSLVKILRNACEGFPDPRRGTNCHYTLSDISLGAFSVFFTQSPSFLAFQTAMQQTNKKSNCQTIFEMVDIPTDNHIRSILDTVEPAYLHEVFKEIIVRLDTAEVLKEFRSLGNDLLVVLDGTQYYTSKKISCEHCLRREHDDGSTSYHHMVLTPAIVTPEKRKAIALEPEFIGNRDGMEKADSEHKAAKRWIERWGSWLSPHGVTIAGDDLYAHQPLIEQILDEDMNFLFVCKPKSHKYLYEWLEIQEHEGEMHRKEKTLWTGKEHHRYRYRYTHHVPLREGDDALWVNWAEVVVTDDTGRIRYTNAFITNHILTDDTVEACVKAGRARWKIENENNNTLKTKGYHLEHNFGHGKHHLSEILATLNILSFLFHTILDLTDRRYGVIRSTLPRRDRFFQDISALMTYFCFSDWDHLMKTMLSGLKLEDPG